MVLPFLFLLWLILGTAGLEQAKNLAGGVLRLIQIRLTTPSLPKIVRVCQDNSPRLRIADSSSRNAVSFSSARATKRFPSPRCASAIQMNKKIGVSQQILTDWQTQDTPRTWLPLSVSVCGIGEPADSCSQRCASPVCRQSSSALATVRSKSKFAKATFHTSEPQHCHP